MPCPRGNCKYAACSNNFPKYACDYFFYTGKTRSAQLTDRRFLRPELCPFFEEDDRKPIRVEIHPSRRSRPDFSIKLGSPHRKEPVRPRMVKPLKYQHLFPEFRRLYDEGESDVHIGELCGATTKAVRDWRFRQNLPANFLANFKYISVDYEIVRKLYDAKCGDKLIAEAVGTTREYISQWRKMKKLPANRNYSRSPVTREKQLKLIEELGLKLEKE